MESAVIHIVDDDESIRTAIARLLRAAGFETQGYASAEDFLSAERPDAPGCIILDVMLPGLSGLELQQKLSKSGNALPIVFLSGSGETPTAALNAGAVAFLDKPVDRDALIAAVTSAIERHPSPRKASHK